MDNNQPQTYELKIRVLGNEVLALALSTTSTSSRWIAISIVSMFSLLTVLGAYGDKLVELYKNLG